jgi:hypothetical protein
MSKHTSKDRASLCLFAYRDGRRCRMLRAADPYLCNYHARREAEDFARQKIGRNISSAFSGECVSATSLSIALARTLAATAQGQLKPRQAAIIAYPHASRPARQPRVRSGLGLRSLAPSHSLLLRPDAFSPRHPHLQTGHLCIRRSLNQKQGPSRRRNQPPHPGRPTLLLPRSQLLRNHLQQSRPCPKTQPRSRTRFSPHSNIEPSGAVTHL